MKLFNWLVILLVIVEVSCAQSSDPPRKMVGGPCEGCEAAFEHPRLLFSSDTIVGYHEFSNPMKVSGTVYHLDGKTPAEDIIIYAYQTNPDGVYVGEDEGSIWAKRHGKHRGWVKTDQKGHYSFYTFMPGSYPGRNEPAHIHLTILEDGKTPYYIDDILFDSDPLLDERKRTQLKERSGSGICRIDTVHGLMSVRRDITLGLNIPGY